MEGPALKLGVSDFVKSFFLYSAKSTILTFGALYLELYRVHGTVLIGIWGYYNYNSKQASKQKLQDNAMSKF